MCWLAEMSLTIIARKTIWAPLMASWSLLKMANRKNDWHQWKSSMSLAGARRAVSLEPDVLMPEVWRMMRYSLLSLIGGRQHLGCWKMVTTDEITLPMVYYALVELGRDYGKKLWELEEAVMQHSQMFHEIAFACHILFYYWGTEERLQCQERPEQAGQKHGHHESHRPAQWSKNTDEAEGNLIDSKVQRDDYFPWRRMRVPTCWLPDCEGRGSLPPVKEAAEDVQTTAWCNGPVTGGTERDSARTCGSTAGSRVRGTEGNEWTSEPYRLKTFLGRR